MRNRSLELREELRSELSFKLEPEQEVEILRFFHSRASRLFMHTKRGETVQRILRDWLHEREVINNYDPLKKRRRPDPLKAIPNALSKNAEEFRLAVHLLAMPVISAYDDLRAEAARTHEALEIMLDSGPTNRAVITTSTQTIRELYLHHEALVDAMRNTIYDYPYLQEFFIKYDIPTIFAASADQLIARADRRVEHMDSMISFDLIDGDGDLPMLAKEKTVFPRHDDEDDDDDSDDDEFDEEDEDEPDDSEEDEDEPDDSEEEDEEVEDEEDEEVEDEEDEHPERDGAAQLPQRGKPARAKRGLRNKGAE